MLHVLIHQLCVSSCCRLSRCYDLGLSSKLCQHPALTHLIAHCSAHRSKRSFHLICMVQICSRVVLVRRNNTPSLKSPSPITQGRRRCHSSNNLLFDLQKNRRLSATEESSKCAFLGERQSRLRGSQAVLLLLWVRIFFSLLTRSSRSHNTNASLVRVPKRKSSVLCLLAPKRPTPFLSESTTCEVVCLCAWIFRAYIHTLCFVLLLTLRAE